MGKWGMFCSIREFVGDENKISSSPFALVLVSKEVSCCFPAILPFPWIPSETQSAELGVTSKLIKNSQQLPKSLQLDSGRRIPESPLWWKKKNRIGRFSSIFIIPRGTSTNHMASGVKEMRDENQGGTTEQPQTPRAQQGSRNAGEAQRAPEGESAGQEMPPPPCSVRRKSWVTSWVFFPWTGRLCTSCGVQESQKTETDESWFQAGILERFDLGLKGCCFCFSWGWGGERLLSPWALV